MLRYSEKLGTIRPHSRIMKKKQRKRTTPKGAAMKLTRELKEQVEKAESVEEKRQLIEDAGMELSDEELEQIAGGLGNLKNPIVYIGKAL